MKLKLSDQAQKDLQDISDYTWAQWGEEQEKRYLSMMYRAMQGVAENPQKGRPRDDLFSGCYMELVGKHMIFFTVEQEAICVARILHQAMDFSRHLP